MAIVKTDNNNDSVTPDGRETPPPFRPVPMYNHDGSEMRDHMGRIVYRNQYLSTHPIRSDIKERMGYAGKKLAYVSGEGIIRTLNLIFGHTGWSTEVTEKREVQCEKDELGRWVVGYIATVRITLSDGTAHEDCGSGEGINPNKVACYDKALKSAITDAMKRAARHFGDRLGNALYRKGSGLKTAPVNDKKAIEDLERLQSSMFGEQGGLKHKINIDESISPSSFVTMTPSNGGSKKSSSLNPTIGEVTPPQQRQCQDQHPQHHHQKELQQQQQQQHQQGQKLQQQHHEQIQNHQELASHHDDFRSQQHQNYQPQENIIRQQQQQQNVNIHDRHRSHTSGCAVVTQTKPYSADFNPVSSNVSTNHDASFLSDNGSQTGAAATTVQEMPSPQSAITTKHVVNPYTRGPSLTNSVERSRLNEHRVANTNNNMSPQRGNTVETNSNCSNGGDMMLPHSTTNLTATSPSQSRVSLDTTTTMTSANSRSYCDTSFQQASLAHVSANTGARALHLQNKRSPVNNEERYAKQQKVYRPNNRNPYAQTIDSRLHSNRYPIA